MVRRDFLRDLGLQRWNFLHLADMIMPTVGREIHKMNFPLLLTEIGNGVDRLLNEGNSILLESHRLQRQEELIVLLQP